MVKFIHCADLHLDSPFKSKQQLSTSIFEDVQKSAYESFKKIVDVALKEDVDFMLIVGDLFDSENRKLQIIGLIMYQYFQIVLKPIKRLPKLENKFIFMVLVIKTIQVMKIKLMNIHLVKEVMVYI